MVIAIARMHARLAYSRTYETLLTTLDLIHSSCKIPLLVLTEPLVQMKRVVDRVFLDMQAVTKGVPPGRFVHGVDVHGVDVHGVDVHGVDVHGSIVDIKIIPLFAGPSPRKDRVAQPAPPPDMQHAEGSSHGHNEQHNGKERNPEPQQWVGVRVRVVA